MPRDLPMPAPRPFEYEDDEVLIETRARLNHLDPDNPVVRAYFQAEQEIIECQS